MACNTAGARDSELTSRLASEAQWLHARSVHEENTTSTLEHTHTHTHSGLNPNP